MLRGLEAHRGRTVLPAWGQREAGCIKHVVHFPVVETEDQRGAGLTSGQPVRGSASTRMLGSCLYALFAPPNLIFPK